MVTGKQYAEAAVAVYETKPQIGYIYGTRFVKWTKARQDALVSKYNSNPEKYKDYKLSAEIGSKWIGHIVTDCSGLTSKLAADFGLKFHWGSNSSYLYDCAYKGKKEAGMKFPAGCWMYTGEGKHGHIGIVDPSREWVIEAQGTKAGVTRTKVSNKKWTYWGLGKGMEFDFIPGEAQGIGEPAYVERPVEKEPAKEQNQTSGQTATDGKAEPTKIYYPTLRRGAKGDLVTQLQRFLAQDGSSLAIDGIFGPGTQSAVRAFQKKYGLLVDGVVGPQTWGKLLELYA